MPNPLPQVAVGLIIDERGRLLLQHRDDRPDVTEAGHWGFFGGHVDPGERPSAAFLREIDEELGWRPRHFEHYLTREVTPISGRGWHVLSHVFAAHLDIAPDALDLREGQDLGLFAPDALPDAVVPGIVPIIAEFARSDAYRRLRKRWESITTAALIVDADGRFVLQHRDDKPGIANPGLWGSFGGEVDAHEPPDEGLVRELEEELCWRPDRHELYGAGPYIQGGEELVYVYAVALDTPLDRLTLREGQGFAAFAPDALPAGTVPELRTLIERFSASDAYRRTIEAAR